jgi:tRNA pseudouridine32 synthase/23S rRNA pseudouridine746 synthase
VSQLPFVNPAHFHAFQTSIEGIDIPERLNFPFHYTPYEIALLAATELRQYLETQQEWEHNFGADDPSIVGKMFGVLVVRNSQGELGYLCAVSGKLAGHNQHVKFVPPVFDILEEDGFFRRGEAIISEINDKIEALKNSVDYLHAQNRLEEARRSAAREIEECRSLNKEQKKVRDKTRRTYKAEAPHIDHTVELRRLEQQSINEHYRYKQLKKDWATQIASLEAELGLLDRDIDKLKEERKQRSGALQQEIFDRFYFVDRELQRCSVKDIFMLHDDGKPPAGAGECAAPKLFQYAFLHNMTPVALAEFWWGQSPKNEVRVHGNYYPACRGKCEPILGHMLRGLAVDENPLLQNPGEQKQISILWEDEYIAVVHKPHDLLSVPGKMVKDSVRARLAAMYPNATGPLVVHRLDMSTSGVMLIAKTLDIYRALQRQFEQREIKKRYIAWLDGLVQEDEGQIDLPLRVDLDNRPRQLVCYEHGKKALTRWEVVERVDGKTKIYFYPITGRTHQLRLHAAHLLGLNAPIAGDELYGKSSSRLFLHAERIEFLHPITQNWVVVESQPNFDF